MNQQELQQKIAEYYSKLPENLQKFFADMKWINTLQGINTKYNLTPKQIETLATETTLVLLCIIDMSEYVKTIEDSIKLSTEQMNQLISEINDNIFKDIGYELEDTFIKNINDLTKENENKENTTITNSEIPLPPYGNVESSKEKVVRIEEKIKTESEVPLPQYNENPIPKTEQDIYKETHMAMKDSGIDIIEGKLFNPTISTPTTSDHSLPKMGDK